MRSLLLLFVSQLAVLCIFRILVREQRTRAFYFALREIADEQQRCERVLGLLLPSTLVSSMHTVVVEAKAGSNRGERPAGGRRPAAGSWATSPTDSGVIDVVSVGEERFADSFQSASVLFAEGPGGKGGTRQS